MFRLIFWYHSLFLKKIFRSYSGFRPFFGIHFLARNSKTAHLWDMVPILSCTLFSISYQMAYSHFWGVEVFWKLFLYSSEFDASRKNIFVLTMLLLNGNRFNVPKWRIDAEMADVSNAGRRGRLLLATAMGNEIIAVRRNLIAMSTKM